MKASLSCSCGGVVFFYGVGYLSVPAAEQSTEADFFFPILLHRLKMGPGLLRESGQAGEHRSLAAVCSWRFLQGRPVGDLVREGLVESGLFWEGWFVPICCRQLQLHLFPPCFSVTHVCENGRAGANGRAAGPNRS